MPAVRGTRLRAERPRLPPSRPCVEPAKITPTPPAPAQRILAAGICFMCPGGNPTDRREFSRISSAAIRDARRALPAYTENQPKSAHLSPKRGVFDFSIFNYVVLTTEFGANSPNSPSRRARQHRNLKFRCFNNVNNFAKRKCTHISGGAVSGRAARTYTAIYRNSRVPLKPHTAFAAARRQASAVLPRADRAIEPASRRKFAEFPCLHRFFRSVTVNSTRQHARVTMTQRHGCPAGNLRASLTDDRYFRCSVFRITLF